jgi:YD repeat-containing protein
VTFDWDEGNLSHIERHGVRAAEVEEALAGPVVWDQPYVRNGEERATAWGRTQAGRILAITITMRGAKLRVITAHTAKKRERKRYAEHEKSQSG